MAKGTKNIPFGVATKVAGVIASKSFDAIAGFIKNFGSEKISPDDIANLQIEIEKLKLKTEETERECETLKEALSEKDALIKKLTMKNNSLSRNLIWCTVISFILFVAMIVFIIL